MPLNCALRVMTVNFMLRVWYHNLKKEGGLARGSHGRGEGESQLIQGFCLGWGRRLATGVGGGLRGRRGLPLGHVEFGMSEKYPHRNGRRAIEMSAWGTKGGVAGESPAFRAI